MRIALLSTFDVAGGAARAAYRLHRGLRALGQDSQMLVAKKTSTDSEVSEVVPASPREASRRREQLERIERYGIGAHRTAVSNTLFTLSDPGFDLTDHPAVAEADVLNVHWVARLLSPASIAQLQSLGKPLVWTLHDQRAFTGGCHFSAGCLGFETDCGSCPQLDHALFDLTRASLADAAGQIRAREIQVITPSHWLADCAGRSALFRDAPITVVPYGIDTKVYHPQPRDAARQALGWPMDAICFLFGADNVEEKRKGFGLLLDALRRSALDATFREALAADRIRLVVFGSANDRLSNCGMPFHALGRIESEVTLAQIYAAADAFLLPSEEDNLPNTVLEAMCCGTPVIAQRVGGVPDAVTHGVDGWLTAPGDAAAFAEAIASFARDPHRRQAWSAQCATTAPVRFTLERQAQRYVEIFENALTRSGRAAPTSPSSGTQAPTCPMMGFGPSFQDLFDRLAPLADEERRKVRGGVWQRVQREARRFAARRRQ